MCILETHWQWFESIACVVLFNKHILQNSVFYASPFASAYVCVSAFVNGPVPPDNKAVIRKTELTKKMEAQIQSPTRRSVLKPAVRQTRPTQHHSCPRRRPTGDTFPWCGAFCRRATRTPVPTASHLHCQLPFGFGIHSVVFFMSFFVFDHNKIWLLYIFYLASFVLFLFC